MRGSLILLVVLACSGLSGVAAAEPSRARLTIRVNATSTLTVDGHPVRVRAFELTPGCANRVTIVRVAPPRR